RHIQLPARTPDLGAGMHVSRSGEQHHADGLLAQIADEADSAAAQRDRLARDSAWQAADRRHTAGDRRHLPDFGEPPPGGHLAAGGLECIQAGEQRGGELVLGPIGHLPSSAAAGATGRGAISPTAPSAAANERSSASSRTTAAPSRRSPPASSATPRSKS